MNNKHIKDLEPLLRDLSDQIWQFAEISLREYKSASLLADACRNEGFQVEEGIAGMPTAFVARWGSRFACCRISCRV
jgi:aminobenzoyl-glutamate utilization protein B